MSTIISELIKFETIMCPNCKYDMELYNTLWYCSNCGNKMHQNETMGKKYISKKKLKKYILMQNNDELSRKIIYIYLKNEGYNSEIYNNINLINNLLIDLKINSNLKTHKLFNL